MKYPRRPRHDPASGLPSLVLAVLLALFSPASVFADVFPLALHGQWFQAPPGWLYPATDNLQAPELQPAEQVRLTGGRFFHLADFEISQPATVVVDFKNTQTIAQFHHWIFDAAGKLVAEARGGMLDEEPDPFFLTHGRQFSLASGHYRLVTEIDSPFYIAQPQPYLDTLEHYRQAIKLPAALGMLCLGILLGLGIYYFTLAVARRNLAEAMYAIFIAGNFIFDSAALLVLPELFGIRSFALLGMPILFTNAVYIVFVLALLKLRHATHPRLFQTGLALIAMLMLFIVAALLLPHWALELERAGVAVFLLFGLISGIVRARDGSIIARLYLAAVSLFFIVGGITITASRLHGIYTLHIEHLGALAVTAEVLALALVLSYQFAQLKLEKDAALTKHAQSLQLARTDVLTGLPNRLALEADLTPLPELGCLTFIDMDGLKYYNDYYGHDRGDDLLRAFSRQLLNALRSQAKVYRLGGDEFAVVSWDRNGNAVESAVREVLANLRRHGYDRAAASYGTAKINEASTRQQLMNLADRRMYEHKYQNRERTTVNPV